MTDSDAAQLLNEILNTRWFSKVGRRITDVSTKYYQLPKWMIHRKGGKVEITLFKIYTLSTSESANSLRKNSISLSPSTKQMLPGLSLPRAQHSTVALFYCVIISFVNYIYNNVSKEKRILIFKGTSLKQIFHQQI